MRILILNWRDICNPSSGGAEKLTHEMAKRWVKMGNSVTLFSAGFKGCRKDEIIDGVCIIRKGRWWNVHFFAIIYYLFIFKKKFDVVVDEVHWFPFFSAVYARKKTVLLACEVANKLIFKLFPYPFAVIIRCIEKIYLYIYKRMPTLTISHSTRMDLIREGFDAKKIVVLPMGLTLPEKTKIFPKENNPTIVFLGRLNRQKGILDAIKAFEIIKKEIFDCKFWVIGQGREDYLNILKNKVTEAGFSSDVVFFGYVSEEDKYKYLSKAHVLIVPSIHEGWGLTVHEAGIVKTPSVVYNVAGLRELVKDKINGFIVSPEPEFLAKAVISLLKNKRKYNNVQNNAYKIAKNHTWDKAARMSFSELKKRINS